MAKELDPKNITGVQKTAIFLLSMGEEYTMKVFERMNDEAISEIGVEMSRINQITPEMLKVVSLDYIERFEGETKIIVEGANGPTTHEADKILRDLKGKKLTKELISGIPWRTLKKLAKDYQKILNQ